MEKNMAQRRYEQLLEAVRYHNERYYVYDDPEIDDYEYDALTRELKVIEKEYPEFVRPDSPTRRVGGEALRQFEPVAHAVQMGSLQDVFSKFQRN